MDGKNSSDHLDIGVGVRPPPTNPRSPAQSEAPSLTTRQIHYTAVALLAAAIVVLVKHLWRGEISFLVALALVLLLHGAGVVLMHRGMTWPISILTPLLMLGLLTHFVYRGHGIHDISVAAFPLVVILAGLMLGKRALLAYGLACFVALAGLYMAEVNGLIETPLSVATDPGDLANIGIIVSLTVVLLWLLIGNLTDSLARIRGQERALAERNAELEQFSYTVSHDLRSPLVTIRGFLGFVERSAVEGNIEQLRKDLQRVNAATDRMEQLLKELLDLSKVGRVVQPPELLLFAEVANEAVSLAAGPIAEAGTSVIVQQDLPEIFGDRLRLVELIQNLIENAVKFMGDQPRPRVEIGARRQADETVYYVEDNGIGIEPRFHDSVFNLFERLDPSIDGTGVGLALVKRIVEFHGGRVWVESEGAGQGTAFCFTVPAPEKP